MFHASTSAHRVHDTAVRGASKGHTVLVEDMRELRPSGHSYIRVYRGLVSGQETTNSVRSASATRHEEYIQVWRAHGV